MTVLEALNTSKQFRDEKDKKKNMQKEILMQRSKGEVPKAAVKTDFPCCLIEEGETLDVTFIQKDENSSTNQQTTAEPSLLSKRSKPETLVTFWVEKGGGSTVTCLLKSEALRERVRYVCVFAFKGKKVKTALKRDGRFNNVIFSKDCGLSEISTETIHELSMPVEVLDRKSFQVVVISDSQPESWDDEIHVKTEPNEASDSDAAENIGPSQNPINTEQEKKQDGNTTKSTNPSTKWYVVKRLDESEEILGILRDQFKDLLETLKKREKRENKSLFQIFSEEYHKSVANFSEVRKVKRLMTLSDSVCQIRVGESCEGTGFLLFKIQGSRFILTNAHVIGEYVPFSMKLTKTFTAVFEYEGVEAKETKYIQVKKLIACFHGTDESGRYLDYALLELDSVDEIREYPELLSCYSPNPPNRGQICIVGHPGEGVKKMDPCFIIERENRLEAANKHASENDHLINVMMEVNSKQKWDFSKYENQITYDSCFFHGSSGSPVFDVDCNLIGIHTGGYVYKEEGPKTWSVMEFSFSIQPILDNIKAQVEAKGLHDIVEILEPYSNKSNVSGAVDPENQSDVVMADAEDSEES
ncbi:Protein FAM111A [Anabarilius grahami]|uniref:Protein FAM111A n=1 Tax=Anabarilius grahami TaxID=495550 RepID=A0A3N0Z640_ANAGA|nr:Protein FAM111A [Anabarilius grahami]